MAEGMEVVKIDWSNKDTVEDSVAPAIGDKVLRLNSYTFFGNVIHNNRYVHEWVILYCLPWFPVCQNIQAAYNTAAAREQDAHNTDILYSKIRFGQVDCATDKVLCNDMGASPPIVVLYQRDRAAASWAWDGKDQDPSASLSTWVSRQLSEEGHLARRRTFLHDVSTSLNLVVCAAITFAKHFWLSQVFYSFDRQDRDLLVGLVITTILVSLSTKFLSNVAHAPPQKPRLPCDLPQRWEPKEHGTSKAGVVVL